VRARGVRTMQLELLVPRGSTHPAKERLRAWYERLRGWYERHGYEVVRLAPFDEVSAQAAHLATACEFLVFHKSLSP
jgi:hypothetical protein